MYSKAAFVALFAFFLALGGCDSSPPEFFEPIEIPPPSDIADSLYTETSTGLKFYDLQEGTGAVAEGGLAVEYHYIMWLSDSTLVRSSYQTRIASVAVLGQQALLPGWEEGLEGMRTGGFRQLIIPPDLAYGEFGQPDLGVPPNETLIMELALIGVGIPVDAAQ